MPSRVDVARVADRLTPIRKKSRGQNRRNRHAFSVSSRFLPPFLSGSQWCFGCDQNFGSGLTCKPRTTDLRPWLWGAALTRRSEHSSPRLPRSDKQEEPKCIFGPSVKTPTSYPSCSSRIGAYARGVRWYGVNTPGGHQILNL